MPSPIDELAVEQAALGLAEGDPTVDWLKAQDTRGSGRTWTLVKIVMRAVALVFALALLIFTSLASDVLTLPFVSHLPLPAGPGHRGKSADLIAPRPSWRRYGTRPSLSPWAFGETSGEVSPPRPTSAPTWCSGSTVASRSATTAHLLVCNSAGSHTRRCFWGSKPASPVCYCTRSPPPFPAKDALD